MAIALHALFQRRVDGDDALLQLARLRFQQADLAAEVYADDPGELGWVLPFVPEGTRPPMVHLSRGIDLLDPAGQDRIAEMARRFGERVSGFVIHDRRHLPDRLPEVTAAGERLSAILTATGSTRLFVEYAAGVPAEQFVAVGEALRNVERVGLCIDTGHVGIRQARTEFGRRRPDVATDLAALDVTDPRLPDLVDDVQTAVASGLQTLVDLIGALADHGKLVHFHLHDGHPLVRGLSDHFGFLTRLAIPFRHRGPASLDPLFGVPGLARILATITQALGSGRSTLTLEIHEHQGRLDLPPEDRERLFGHWREVTNAERMNLWLRDLADNAMLVRALVPRS